MLLLAVPVGLLIGLALGALGGGGSILAVPALVYLLDQGAQEATTGSLVVVGVAAAAALVPQARAGRVRWRRGLLFSALGIVGAVAGSHLGAAVDPDLLLLGFSGLLLLAAGGMTLRRRRAGAEGGGEGGASPGARPAGSRGRASCFVRTALAATAVGLLTGFFGVGGGFVIVPALVLVLGFDLPVAIGTSLLVIALNSGVALAARSATHPDVDAVLIAVFALAAVVGTWLGERAAARLPVARLDAAFRLMLLVLAAAMGTSSLLRVV